MDRRLRILRLSRETVLSLFNFRQHRHIRLPVFGLPDVTVLGVEHDFAHQCFNLLVHHESFATVPDGYAVPEYEAMMELTLTAPPDGTTFRWEMGPGMRVRDPVPGLEIGTIINVVDAERGIVDVELSPKPNKPTEPWDTTPPAPTEKPKKAPWEFLGPPV